MHCKACNTIYQSPKDSEDLCFTCRALTFLEGNEELKLGLTEDQRAQLNLYEEDYIEQVEPPEQPDPIGLDQEGYEIPEDNHDFAQPTFEELDFD